MAEKSWPNKFRGQRKPGSFTLPFDWQLTRTKIFYNQSVQTIANKLEGNKRWHQLSLWQWTHPLSPPNGTQKILIGRESLDEQPDWRLCDGYCLPNIIKCCIFDTTESQWKKMMVPSQFRQNNCIKSKKWKCPSTEPPWIYARWV